MVRQVAGNSRALISRSSQRHPTRMMITTPSFARTTRIFVGINPCLGIFDPFFLLRPSFRFESIELPRGIRKEKCTSCSQCAVTFSLGMIDD